MDSEFRLVEECGRHVTNGRASRSTVRQIRPNVRGKPPFKIHFGTAPQSPFLFLKPGYVKTKCQDKLKPMAFSCFFIGSSTNRPVIPMSYSFLQEMLTLATSLGVVHPLPSLVFQTMFILFMFVMMWTQMSQASPRAFSRTSLQPFSLRFLQLLHVGGPDKQADEVSLRLLR